MEETIKTIIKAFPNYTTDMESTLWNWVIYFWGDNSSNSSFYFELPNAMDPYEEQRENMHTYKVNLLSNDIWVCYEDVDINNLIQKTKEIY